MSNSGYIYNDVIYLSYSDLMSQLWEEFAEDFNGVTVEMVTLRHPYYENLIRRNIDLDDLSTSLKAFMYSELGDEYYTNLDARNIMDKYEPENLSVVLANAIKNICPSLVVEESSLGMIQITESDYDSYWDDSE